MNMKRVLLLLCLALLLAGCGGGGGGGAGSGSSGNTGSSTIAVANSTVASPAGNTGNTGNTVQNPSTTVAVSPTATAGLTPTASSTSAPILMAVVVHSEDQYHPQTPDFLNDPPAYQSFRSGLLGFAEAMQARNLSWNFQSDYNFLEGVIHYEIEQPDPGLLAATDGMNIIRYLHDKLGVEIDPHSHEHDGYNYADIAYLITQTGVEPSTVVGGHIYDPADATYQNWPRFQNPVRGSKFPAFTWQARLLMGAGSPSHVNDPLASGMWHPESEQSYFEDSPSQSLVCFGGYDHDVNHLSELAGWARAGLIDSSKIWTANLVLPHSSLAQPGYLEATVIPQLDKLVELQNQGTIGVVNFENALSMFNGQFAGHGAVFPTGDEYASFSLNVQDFAYPDKSAALVERALNLHEELKVPVDVFLTTTQLDLFESQYPQLLARLFQSSVVSMNYHVRAPKPYANNYDWFGLAQMTLDSQKSVVRNYETHGLDLSTGMPTGNTGGFQKLAALSGKPGVIVGAGEPTLRSAVEGVFAEMGAQMVVDHAGTINLGEQANGLWVRPEHFDLRLFESGYQGQNGADILDYAFTQARAANGAQAPYFVGVKMHDNDFFAVASAWITVYQAKRTPPWDASGKADLLSDAEAEAMWQRYEATVRAAAAQRSQRNLVFGPMLVRLAENAGAANLPSRQSF